MQLLGQGFQKLEPEQLDRQTETQTHATENITTPHSRVSKKSVIFVLSTNRSTVALNGILGVSVKNNACRRRWLSLTLCAAYSCVHFAGYCELRNLKWHTASTVYAHCSALFNLPQDSPPSICRLQAFKLWAWAEIASVWGMAMVY